MFKNGDLILTETKRSWVLKFMRFFQKDPVKYGHVMIVIDAADELEEEFTYVIEAVALIRVTNLFHALKGVNSYKIVRRKDLTDDQFYRLKKSLVSLEDQFYSVKRILLQALDHIFSTNYFTKLSKDNKDQVCSSLAAWAYYVACKIKFNDVTWRSCDPDDIDDETIKNPDDWEVVEVVCE